MSLLPRPILFNKFTPPHILTLTILAAISAIPINIFIASLPEMAEFFGKPYSVMALSISIYLGCTGIAQLFIGPISDRFGRRPVILSSIFIFIIATIGAAMTTSFYLFMFFRCLQAVIIAGSVISRTVVRDMVPREKAASLIGYVTMGMSIAPMLAPPVGGILAKFYGWESNFLALGAAGTIALLFVYFDQGETNMHQTSSFTNQFRSYPDLLRSKRFWGYVAIVALGVGMYFSYLAAAPIIGAGVYGLSATSVSFYLIITPLGYMTGNFLSGRYAQRLGIDKMMLLGAIFGGVILISGLALVAIFPDRANVFFAVTFGIGISNGMILPSANAGLLDVKPELAGSAAGLGGALMTLSGASLGAISAFFLPNQFSAIPLILFLIVVVVLCLVVIVLTNGQESINKTA